MTPLGPGFRMVRDPLTDESVLEVSVGGVALIDAPMFNKGTAFTEGERDALGLRGVLPPRVCTLEEQVDRVMNNYAQKSTDLERYIHLTSLMDRNETLFYRVILDHLEEMLPIIYTPTVGLACQRFGHIYRRRRGLYFTPEDVHHVDSILADWPFDAVRIVVVTDGERILGLGDLGAGGMGIPIGKLSLYVAAGGIHPAQTLPVCLDTGTDNASLLADPLYLGIRRRLVRGEEYDRLVEAFFMGVQKRFPKALIQFEDFAIQNSFRLLDRYRHRGLCFNDDIQGTGGVALAAILSGVRITGTTLDDQRIVIAGAGSAGVGIARRIRAASKKVPIWINDSRGLVTPDRAKPHQKPFAQEEEADDLAGVCRRVRPTILVGVTGRPGLFTEEIIRSMDGPRPMVLPLSNPTSSSECTPDEARTWTDGRALVATGSPFPNTPQCNNVYIFPGIGLGTLMTGADRVTDVMFTAAARAVADLGGDSLLPPLRDIRRVSAAVARALGADDPERAMWQPCYVPYRPARSHPSTRRKMEGPQPNL